MELLGVTTAHFTYEMLLSNAVMPFCHLKTAFGAVLASTWYCYYFEFNNGFALSNHFGFNLCFRVHSVLTIPTNAPLYRSISFLLS